MATTLSSVLQRAYRDLGEFITSQATGGTTATVVDTTITDNEDDDYKNGVVFITRTTDGLAPQEEFQRVSANVASTGTFTVDTVFTATPQSGDTYSIAGDAYPIRVMIQIVNDSLRSLGDVPNSRDESLTTAAGQTEYTVAVAGKRKGPDQVWIQTITGDSDQNGWERIFNWHYEPAVAGTAGKLVFESQPDTGLKLQLWYMGVHSTVNAYNDPIDETLNPDLVHCAVMVEAMKTRMALLTDSEREIMNFWRRELDIAKTEKKPWKPKDEPRLFTLHHDAEREFGGQQIVAGRYGPHVEG